MTVAITIGPGSELRNNVMAGGKTSIDLTNPANAAGKINHVEIRNASAISMAAKAGLFYGTPPNFTCRSAMPATVSVPANSVLSVDNLNLDVEKGDFIGVYCGTSGALSMGTTGGSGVYQYAGDQASPGVGQTYNLSGTRWITALFGLGEGPGETPPPESTVINNLDLRPNFETVSVYANFAGDVNGNNQTLLEYRRPGGAWKRGMDLCVDRRAEVRGFTNPWVNQWRGFIMGLSPNTQYEVRVTFDDPDGVVGENPIIRTTTTRNDNFQLGNGVTYYVAPNGNDSNPGTIDQPWFSPQHAADIVQPGDTVYLRGGGFVDWVQLKTSGQPGNYITWLAYPGETPVIDAGNYPSGFTLNSISYNRFKDFDIQNCSKNPFELIGASHYNVFDDVDIMDFGEKNPDAGVCMHAAAGTTSPGPGHNLIQYSRIHSARISYSDTIHREEGICMYNTDGEGNVIRFNRIYGENGGFSDGVGGGNNFGVYDGPFKDCDIYGNDIGPVNDDGLEIEAGNINVRAWGNNIHDPYMGFGNCTVFIGPLYIFRNTVSWPNSPSGGCVKTGYNSSGPAFYYHNTFYCPFDTGVVGWGESQFGTQNYTSRNNIIRVGNRVILFASGDETSDFDHDCLFTTYGAFARWAGVDYPNLAIFSQQTGQERNGISVEPGLVDPMTGDFRLVAGSPCIDRGVIIPGFNDADSPWPYRGYGPDLGAIEMDTATFPTLSISISGEGTTTPAPGSYPYTPGQVVNIQATPGAGWVFSHWVGEVNNPSSASTTVTMNRSKTVEAVFVLSITLTILVDGEGATVPAAGQYSYAQGTTVDLAATPAPGWMFVTWEEGGTTLSTEQQITVAMNADRAVTAVFEQIVVPPNQYSLSISVLGSGTTNPAPGAYTFNQGEVVTIQAIPSEGYKFDHWEGDLTGTQLTVSFPVNANMSIVAVFVKKEIPGFIELFWDFLPFFPWEGPPFPRFTGWDWNHLPILGGAA